jgi:hypothetical protein
MTKVISLKDPHPDTADASCLGGVYSDCGISPVTNMGVFSGSVENQVFFVGNADKNWTEFGSKHRCAVSIDGSITSCAISIDGTVTACALLPSDEGSELHVIKTPDVASSEPIVNSIKIFETSMFPIRSICFGMSGKLKTKLFAGTDDGKIYSINLSAKKSSGNQELSSAGAIHGGIKCIRSCPLSGNIAASFCDGYVVMFDSNGAEMESRKITKKSTTPDSIEKFFIDWNPKPKERLLAIAGMSVPVVLKSGVWSTTPIPDDAGSNSVDGIVSVVKWNIDGTMIGAVTTAGVIQVYDFAAITGPQLAIRAHSPSNTIVNLAWGYSNDSHVVNGIGLKGVRAGIDNVDYLKKALKVDIAELLSSAKQAAVGNMESGLVEEQAVEDNEKEEPSRAERMVDDEASSSSSSDDSDDDSSAAQSVDESPEQLQEELNDLLGKEEGADDKKNTVKQDGEGGEDEEVESVKENYRGGNRGTSVSVDRQFSFQPGATVGTRNLPNRKGVTRRILCWNQFGSVVRTDFPLAANPSEPNALNEEGLIEVHLEIDSAPMKQFRLKDNLHGWTMASLGGTGLALAVKSRFDITDKYEDDMIDNDEVEKKKREIDELTGGLSKVCYRPFMSWGNQREWIVPLPLKAEVESIAAGTTCLVAIATDSSIRVWSNEGGFMLYCWNMKSEVPVSVSASGDYFFVASVMRSRSTESMNYEIFCIQNNGGRLLHVDNGPLPISSNPGTALCWVGVSEDFVPFTCDTQGVMRGLFPLAESADSGNPKHLWTPLLNFVSDVQKRGEGYWPVFVSERDVWCVPTRAEEDYEPRASPLPPIINIGLRSQSQYVADRNDTVSPESQLFMDRLVASQTRFCARIGLPASAFRTAADGDLEKAAKKLEVAHDKKLADTFRKLLESNKLEKALGGAALAFTSMTSRVMIRMAAALGLRTLESRLEDLFNPSASREHQELSAATTLFPQANMPPPPRIEKSAPSPQEDIQPVKPQTSKEVKQGGGGPVNPFAKKRKVDENNITRNA